MLQEICCCTPVTFKLTFATAAEMMHDDEDWDPTRVKAAKRRAIQRKADRKRRKIKTETELALRQADQQTRERYNRTKHQARDTDKLKRAEASQLERLSREQNQQRMAKHILTKHQARDTNEVFIWEVGGGCDPTFLSLNLLILL